MLAKMLKIDIIDFVNKKEVLMNKEELVKEVAKKAKVSQKAAADVLVATLETVTKAVSKGKKLLWLVSVLLNPEKRALVLAVTLKQVLQLKFVAKTVPAFSAGKKFKEAVK